MGAADYTIMSQPTNNMTNKKPLIGVTMDEDKFGTPPRRRFYLFSLYVEAIVRAGGVPLIVPSLLSQIERYADILDGLLVTGGDFDIPPQSYGETICHESVKPLVERVEFELALAKVFLEKDKALLGICGGSQLINVAFGGSLIQDILALVPHAMNHEQPPPRSRPYHEIELVSSTRLRDEWAGVSKMHVNSAHHQAIKRVGDGLRVNARAKDGIIEGIESEHHSFCLGVQWHPEFGVDGADGVIFSRFIESASS